MEKKSMGSFLTALRKASGLTQKQLAEKLNVSDKAVSRWERDECAPDLSLIPVLAEIYGVTSDEILRGQRMDPEKLYYGNDRAKAVKQRNRILQSTKTKFICRSLITVGAALVGLILAYILNTEFAKANAGFLLGIIFFIAAAVCQTLFLITGFSSVTDEDWQDNSVENCKGFMLLTSEWCLGVIGSAIALCIPLAGKSTVNFTDCVSSGIQWVFAVTAVIAAINIVINFVLKRNRTVNLKNPLNKLRLRSGTVLALVLVLLMGLQVGMNCFLTSHRHLYAPHETVTDLDDFRKLMEEPMTEDGIPMDPRSDWRDGSVIFSAWDNVTETENRYLLTNSQVTKKLIPTDAEPPADRYAFSEKYGYQFRHLNQTIRYYEISETAELVPIYTFTAEQMKAANEMFIYINLIYLFTYVIAATMALTIYKSKDKKL